MDEVAKAEEGMTEKAMRARIRPPILAGLYLLGALGLHYAFPVWKIVRPPYHLLGVIVLGAGIGVTGRALTLFKEAGTTHNPYGIPVALVTTGPFRFTRNPMYLGVTSVLLGIAILIGTLPLFLAPLLFFLTIHTVFIPDEERTLERIFGQQYVDYKSRVRRWL